MGVQCPQRLKCSSTFEAPEFFTSLLHRSPAVLEKKPSSRVQRSVVDLLTERPDISIIKYFVLQSQMAKHLQRQRNNGPVFICTHQRKDAMLVRGAWRLLMLVPESGRY
jgi:hypothetical protein